ncbi:hypothetical protein ACRRS0_02665 [Agarivorans sp. QJM3NY_29]|uniref:hypothetical protein n=1 Tax=unclassified Agarivorans TaxID=2636026 RepID=UPI003D7CC4A7
MAGGSGITYLEDDVTDEQKKQHFRSFDIRFAQHFAQSWRVDLVHANEGHAYNHHRDGFSTHVSYIYVPTDSFRFEIGAGPYMSFNTTVDHSGLELNEKRLGAMSTLSVIYPLSYLSQSAQLRLQLNSYLVPNRPHSNSLLIGLGFDIDNANHQSRPASSAWLNDLSISLVNTKINHGGPTTTIGYSIDMAKHFNHHLALSLAYIDEGGNNGASSRHGFTSQLWKIVPLGSHFEGRIGAGGYLAQDKIEHRSAYDLKGIISFGVNYFPAWHFFDSGYFGLSLSRVMDYQGHQDDADLLRLSIGKRF